MFGKPALITIEGNVPWIVARDRHDGHWFGICPPLNLNAAGDTWTDFVECANETIGLLLGSLFEDGELEAFLRRHGWHQGRPLPPPGTRARFELPFTIEHRNGLEDLVHMVA